jgi:hypothetical protein
VQAVAAAASSLQVVLVGEPVAVHATEAVVVFRIWPAVGEVIVTTGTAATVNVVVAEPVLPAGSVAATMIVWLPAVNPLYGCGLVQAVAAAASSLQVVPVTPLASVAVKTVLTDGL